MARRRVTQTQVQEQDEATAIVALVEELPEVVEETAQAVEEVAIYDGDPTVAEFDISKPKTVKPLVVAAVLQPRNIGYEVDKASPTGWHVLLNKELKFGRDVEGNLPRCGGCGLTAHGAVVKLWVVVPNGPLADGIPDNVLEIIERVPEMTLEDGTVIPAVIFGFFGTSCLKKLSDIDGNPLKKPSSVRGK